jgi:uncharacterized membrane protein
MVEDERIEELERRTEELARRIAYVERRVSPPPTPPPPPVPAGATAGLGRLVDRTTAVSLEDLVGGRLLAWAGGAAVLAGIVLLFGIAVSRGWIGEGVRTLLAATGAFALGALGVWLQEKRSRTEAALAATATSIAGLFVTITVAAQVYDLVPAIVGVVLAAGVGAAATTLAVRWRAQGIAALGIVGALLAPVLAGAPSSGGTLVLLWIAAAAATAVVLWQRWPWLSAAAFALTTAQWAAYLDNARPAASVVLALTAFGALNAVAALGYELRVRAERLRPSSAILLWLNAMALAAAGGVVLGHTEATVWVAALGVVHLALGIVALRSSRVAHEIAVLVCGLGVVLADVALALALDGTPRAIAYAGGAVALAALVRSLRAPGLDERVLGAGLGAHLSLAIGQALTGPARPDALVHAGGASSAAVAVLVAIAGACFGAGALAGDERRSWRVGLHATGLAAVAYLSALSLDGPWLAFGWAAEAVALAGIARRGRDEVAFAGAGAFAALAALHALVFEAPPSALVDGLRDLPAAGLALGGVGMACLALGRARPGAPRHGEAALGAAAVTLLYLASTALIDAFGPAGQMPLSALWGVVGTVALVAGLWRDHRELRIAALSLLLVALAKVAIYDVSALASGYRVGSCIALGLLLMGGGFAWQRMRQAPPLTRKPWARSAGQTTPVAKRVP